MGQKSNDGLDRREFIKTASVGAVGMGLAGMSANPLMAEEPGGMPKRALGKTGMNVSVIGFGCGGVTPQMVPLLQTAFDNGINLFDTAWGYAKGQSQLGIGKFVETLKDRESIYIVTKSTGWNPPRGSTNEVYNALKKRLTSSLKDMKTEYVDLFYWPHGATDLKGTEIKACREALLKLKEEKLIRHIGTSSHRNYAKLCEDAIDDGYYEVLMPVINICTQNPDAAGELAPGRRRRGRGIDDTRNMLKMAKKKKVGIIGMKVANPGFMGTQADALLKEAFPEEEGLSKHQKLYSWMLRDDAVASVLVGIRSAKHLMEAIAVGNKA
jgi:L-galactose dehydrogenase/L-glyceraldehyde 3-phosphate reductase